MKLLFTVLAVLSITTTASANYIDKVLPLTSPPSQIVIGYEGIISVANGDRITRFEPTGGYELGYTVMPGAYALAQDPLDDTLMYASEKVNGVSEVALLDVGDLLQTFSITSTPGAGITALAVDPVYEYPYVANASDQEIDILNINGSSTIKTKVPMPAKPTGIATSALNGLAYISLANGEVVTISLKTHEIVSTTQVGKSLSGIVVDPYGEGRVYALDNDVVEALDPTATIIRKTFAVPPGTVGGNAYATTTYLGDGEYEYSGDHEIFISGSNGTSVFNGTTYKIINTIPQAAGTFVLTDPLYNKIYVSSSTANELLVLEK